MHRCYAPHAAADRVDLAADEAHHLTRVLRARAGDEVIAFDGRGREWRAAVEATFRDRVTLRLLEPRLPVKEPPVSVTLAIGLLKGDQMNDVVRDATALGASAILPFVSDHTATPDRAWHERVLDKWQRIAVAAAKQSGRAVVPDMQSAARLDDVLDRACDRRIACVEPARVPRDVPVPNPPSGGRVLLLVGPEGGWSSADVTRLERAGAQLLTLGPRTLRAELAPAVALSVLWATWGWVES